MIHARSDYNHIQDPSGKIPEKEPVFLLRGQDAFTPILMQQWIDMYLESGGDEKKAAQLSEHIKRVEEWQKIHYKIPDIPDDVMQ